MRISFNAVYDGESLRPEQPVDLPANIRLRVIVEDLGPEQMVDKVPASIRRALARAEDLGVPNLAERHDDYLHDVP
jgi:hypothetical protein